MDPDPARRAVELLSEHADDERSAAMAAYMKSTMPFFGVAKPQRGPILRALLAEFPVETPDHVRSVVLALWNEGHRETKYLALGYARRHRARTEHLDLYERLIRDGAWWDLVDEIAIKLVGPVARTGQVWTTIDQWADDDDLWVRRTALICQVDSKEHTDEARLFTWCRQLAHETDFFMRKAIGWALRSYSATAPEAVADFPAEHGGELSGLSYREAARRLPTHLEQDLP